MMNPDENKSENKKKSIDFTLPGDEYLQKSSGRFGNTGNYWSIAIFIVTAAILLLNIHQYFSIVHSPSGEPANGGKAGYLSPDKEKELALLLEDRGLFHASAESWKNYFSWMQNSLKPDEKARIYYRIGKCFQEAGEYEPALEYYYRSEKTAKPEDITLEIAERKKDCFTSLGNITGLNREIRAETTMPGDKKPEEEEVLAEVGATKITSGDLQRYVEDMVDMQLGPAGMGLSSDEQTERKKEIMSGMLEGDKKNQVLQSMIQEELFYREALASGLDKDTDIRKTLDMTRRSILASIYLRGVLEKVRQPTEDELKIFFDRNKDMFEKNQNNGSDSISVAVPQFKDVVSEVRAAWMDAERKKVLNDLGEKLSGKYDVKIYGSKEPGGK